MSFRGFGLVSVRDCFLLFVVEKNQAEVLRRDLFGLVEYESRFFFLPSLNTRKPKRGLCELDAPFLSSSQTKPSPSPCLSLLRSLARHVERLLALVSIEPCHLYSPLERRGSRVFFFFVVLCSEEEHDGRSRRRSHRCRREGSEDV